MNAKKVYKKRISRSQKVHHKARLKSAGKFRVSIFRSLNHIYAQLIDDSVGKTLASASSVLLKDQKGDKKEIAKLVGLDLAKKVQDAGITKVCFDRGRFLYHGRVESLANGLREGGLKV